METRIVDTTESEEAATGAVVVRVTLDQDDLSLLKTQALRALEIERGLPADNRSPLADSGEGAYLAKFVESRAVWDALEARSIVPVAMPQVRSAGYVEGEPYTYEIRVVPRPEIGLSSLEPVDLATTRIPKPGFSTQAAREGSDNVEFVDDEKTLRIALVNRLNGEFSETAMRALADDYKRAFEIELGQRNIDPESYRLAHGLNEEQYDLMMARRSLSDAHWDCALDAVAAGKGLAVTDDDLLATFELQCPGHGADLLELHELRGDLHLTAAKVRHGKALMWLKENALS